MRKIIFIVPVLFILLIGCKEENFRVPYGPDNGQAPGKIQFLEYESTPGGAIVKYKSPDDEDLLYVKATYTLTSGRVMEVKASVYDNQIEVVGYNDTEEKEVLFYTVDRYENVGEPVSVKIKPGVSALTNAFNTISIHEAFGGATISLQNEDRGNLVVSVITPDSTGQMGIIEDNYTSLRQIRFAVRGYTPQKRVFGVYLRDRWDNLTDTVYKTLTPWEEHELHKGNFREVVLETDIRLNAWGFSMAHIWNNEYGWGMNDMCHSEDFPSYPVWFTFDLGVTAQLSRYMYWQRLQEGSFYRHGNMKNWEVYGRADIPPANGSWDGWILLCECESFKPSGLPPGEGSFTQEDIDYAVKGEEFEFSSDLPPVRYIRFKVLGSFDDTHTVHFSEISFFGQVTE